MKPWFRRILLVVVILGLVGLGAVFAAWRALDEEPDWYENVVQASRETTVSADPVLISAAGEVNERHREPDEDDPITLSVSEAQLNGLLQGRSAFADVRQLRQVIEEPALDIRDGQLVLAGRVKELGRFVALTLEPSVEEDALRLDVVGLRGGRLPLPVTLLDRWREPASTGLQRRLPSWKQQAALNTANLANDAASAALHGELALHVLRDESGRNALMVPVDEGRSGWMPVRVQSINLADDTLTIEVVPLTDDERQALLEDLR